MGEPVRPEGRVDSSVVPRGEKGGSHVVDQVNHFYLQQVKFLEVEASQDEWSVAWMPTDHLECKPLYNQMDPKILISNHSEAYPAEVLVRTHHTF